MEQQELNITIGISTCLLGEKVRYDTGHKHNSYITKTLGQYFQFRAFCPEMAIGLGTPRETLRLVDTGDSIDCVGTKTPGHNVTEALIASAHEQVDWQKDLCGYILKKDSPSCGMERVKVYKGDMPERKGRGIYAGVLQDNFPFLPVEEEGRLGDPILRENFIQRVFAMRHWKDVEEYGWTRDLLTDFHAQYKYVLLSHHQQKTRDLGRWLAESVSIPLDEVVLEYFKGWMTILKIRATRKNHVNVLQHLQGFLKQDISTEDKEELVDVIERYRVGQLPLIVPVTLLKHHFRKFPKPFVDKSIYLTPHPSALMLLNHI